MYAYEQIQDELNANEPVAVPHVEGQQEALAVNNIRDKDLEPNVVRQFSDTEEGRVVRPGSGGG